MNGENQTEKKRESLVQQMERLGVSEKVKIAMRGGSEERKILIRESNKQIVMAVLENPRITDSEVEAIARNRSIMDEALRAIAKNREWTKNYAIQLALVNNPKTPPALAVRFVSNLKKRDLSMLEKNRNVSEAVRATAKKILKTKAG